MGRNTQNYSVLTYNLLSALLQCSYWASKQSYFLKKNPLKVLIHLFDPFSLEFGGLYAKDTRKHLIDSMNVNSKTTTTTIPTTLQIILITRHCVNSMAITLS